MFSEARLKAILPINGLGEPLYFYKSIGSTNDRAQELAREGTGHGTLVIADSQSAGRGRFQRKWSTPPRSALAFSLVLRPGDVDPQGLARLNMLGALAVVQSLRSLGLDARLKWPNDVILQGGKVAGVLTEGSWLGQRLEYAILGIGVNVGSESVPDPEEVDYPATCVEGEGAGDVRREGLLVDILNRIGTWLERIDSEEIHAAFEEVLAFWNQQIRIFDDDMEITGVLKSLSPDCRLRVLLDGGEVITVGGDQMQIRPVDMDMDWATLN